MLSVSPSGKALRTALVQPQMYDVGVLQNTVSGPIPKRIRYSGVCPAYTTSQ